MAKDGALGTIGTIRAISQALSPQISMKPQQAAMAIRLATTAQVLAKQIWLGRAIRQVVWQPAAPRRKSYGRKS